VTLEEDISYETLTDIFDLSNLDFTDENGKDPDDLQWFITNEALAHQYRNLGITYVVKYRNQLIGYFTLATSYFRQDAIPEDKRPITFGDHYLPAVVIEFIAIDKPNRSRGIGKKALQESYVIGRSIADRVGCRYVILYVNINNIQGIQFYERNGFKKSEIMEDEKDMRKRVYRMMYKDLFPELRSKSFVPKDPLRLVLSGESERNVDIIWMRYSYMPGDTRIGQGIRWSIQLDSGPEVAAEHATMYFNANDTNAFRNRVVRSLSEKKDEEFVPKNIVFNPGDHDIHHILVGFTEKGGWYIKLDNGLAEISFSEKDARHFGDWLSE
jgi:ribosomal protein S18 acetylase RimI-like enzyme